MKILACILIVIITVFNGCSLFERSYAAFIIAGSTSGPGIDFTDILPDDTLDLSGHPDTLIKIQFLDLNHDKIDDFEVLYQIASPTMLGGDYRYLYLTPLNNNSIAVNNQTDLWAEPILAGDTISSNNTWVSQKTIIYGNFFRIPDNHSYYGYWGTDSDKYVGVKIILEENELYGWIDFKRNVIKAYAISKSY
jgi:hypothetical protein